MRCWHQFLSWWCPYYFINPLLQNSWRFSCCATPLNSKGLCPVTCSYLFHNISNLKCSEIMWFTSHVWVCLYSKRTCCEQSLAPKITTKQPSKGKQTAFLGGRVKASPAVPDIGNVGHPLEVCWDGIKADKKPREQKDWDGSNWAHKSCHLWREGREFLLSERQRKSKN